MAEKKSALLERLVSRLEKKAAAKEDLLKKYELLGLCILVAIPLPGTGAWTGSLVAAVFDIRLKHAFPAIALGVLIAAVIVSVVTYGVTIFIDAKTMGQRRFCCIDCTGGGYMEIVWVCWLHGD